jgi:hypothetical protein
MNFFFISLSVEIIKGRRWLLGCILCATYCHFTNQVAQGRSCTINECVIFFFNFSFFIFSFFVHCINLNFSSIMKNWVYFLSIL